MRRGIAVACLLFFLAPGCGESEEFDAREESYRAALSAANEARELQRVRNREAARESFRRAHDLALGALREDGERSRAEVLNLLSNICLELGAWSPGYLGRAVRYADHALRERPGWPLPRFNLGVAFARAGWLDRAAVILREFLEAHEAIVAAHPGEEIPDPGARAALSIVFVESGKRALQQDRAGAEGVARRYFEKAWALAPDRRGDPGAQERLSQLGREYAERANAAIEAGETLEAARIHASFGHFPPASEALTKARNELGRTLEVRWVEARYVEEMQGTEEGFGLAARHYDELIGRGERVVHAAAGLSRCLRALGRGEEALDRFGDFPEPSPELRSELIRLRLDRIRGLPAAKGEEAEAEFARIEALFSGGLEPEERASLLLDAAAAALDRGNRDRLAKTTREFQNLYPRDLRLVILEAGLQEISGEPIAPGVPARKRDG